MLLITTTKRNIFNNTVLMGKTNKMNVSQFVQYINKTVFKSLEEDLPSEYPILAKYKQIRFMRKLMSSTVDVKGCMNTPLVINYKYKIIPSIQDLKLQVLISLMLSPQTKDEMTFDAFENMFIDSLKFDKKGVRKGISIEYLKQKKTDEIDELIKKVGFHKRKAQNIKDLSELTEVPEKYEEVLDIKGVGPKIGLLYMQNGVGENMGIGVDTHVNRFASKFEWIKNDKGRKPLKNAEYTRELLEASIEKKFWAEINLILVGFGQNICTSTQRPKCDVCLVSKCKDRRVEIDETLKNGIVKDIEDLDISYLSKENADKNYRKILAWKVLVQERYGIEMRFGDEDLLGDWDQKFDQLSKELYGYGLLEEKDANEPKFKKVKIEVKQEII